MPLGFLYRKKLMLPKLIFTRIFLAFLVAWFSATIPATAQQASIESLRGDVKFLASEELRGRNVTDPTINVARDYLRDRMEAIGLQLDTVQGKPFQTVEIPVGSEVRSNDKNFCRFKLGSADAGSDGDDNSIVATLQDGFGPLAIGINEGVAAGRVIFVGYGITSKEQSYDDYQSVDAKGAIVIVMRKEPGAGDPDSPFGGVKNTRHAYFATKITNAIAHGALGVLIVNDSSSTREAVQKVQNRIDQELRRKEGLQKLLTDLPQEAVKNRAATTEKISGIDRMIQAMQADRTSAERGVLGVSDAGTQSKRTNKIPVASIARDTVNQILQAAGGSSLAEIEKQIDQTFQPASRSLDLATATLSVDLKPAVAISDNVIGRIPGKGSLASQTVVVGAHYDHVGMGGYGSLAPGTIAIHNGADDNASGTAAMLACGTILKQRLSELDSHRTLLFIAFTGEERGLVGSRYYVEHPVLPNANTAAMINLDMVGRLRDNELSVYGTGSASGMEQVVDAANADFEFNLFKVASGYGPSDHQSFYRKRIPVLFFFTGVHNDYHRPSDDFDKIEFQDLKRITDMVSDVAYRFAVQPERPVYAKTDPKVQIRRQMTAFLGIRVSQQNGSVKITEVTEGGPAALAGLQTGDQIQRIGRSTIRNTDDVLSWVRNHAPGDKFEIDVRRDGNLVKLRGKLEKRPDK